MFSLLILGAGDRVDLVTTFRDDAIALGISAQIISADQGSEWSAACHLSESALKLPDSSFSDSLPRLLDICERDSVRLVIPASEFAVKELSAAAPAFRKIGAYPVVSESTLVDSILDPTAIHDFMRRRQIAFAPGTEITAARGTRYDVDLFFDSNGALRVAVPHRIKLDQDAKSVGWITAREPAIDSFVSRFAENLKGARGPMNFEAVVSNSGEITLLGFRAFFGEQFALTHRAGAKFCRWLLQEALRAEPDFSLEWDAGITLLKSDAFAFKEGSHSTM